MKRFHLDVRFAPESGHAGATNVQFVPQADISARLADGLIFEFELFDLPYSAPDPRLGHSR
jgi:hypothetical protein